MVMWWNPFKRNFI